MNGTSALRDAIASVPVPGAPPRFTRRDAASGLSLLDSALRLDHVRRLTERLTVVRHGAAQRRSEVDISLRLLDPGQRGDEPGAASTIWVPVSRISRRSAPPEVYDAAGQRLPRLTQLELARQLSAGLYRLLVGILASHPDARGDSLAFDLLHQAHEARWLIQHALESLLSDQHRPVPDDQAEPPGDAITGQGAHHRRLALKVLDEYQDTLHDYFALFDVAVTEYLLVVPLDSSRDEHLVTYEMPLYAEPSGGGAARLLRTSADGYHLGYHSRISSSVRSYRLVLETEPGVHIERMFLSTNADSRLVEELHDDLGVLADRHYRPAPDDRSPAKKIVELQTQTTLRKLADLVRRREWEAEHAGVQLPRTLPSCSLLARVGVAGEGQETEDNAVDSSILGHPLLSSAVLRAAAAELVDREVHRDLSTERDPTSHRAYAQWQRSLGPGRDSGVQIDLHAAALLRDTTTAGPRSVQLYALAVAAMGFVAGCFLTARLWPFAPGAAATVDAVADAVVAVLLLVPGFLYTRLSLPDRHSVAGQLRALPRLVAASCIAAVAVVAAAVATGLPGGFVLTAIAGMITVPLAGAALLQLRRRKGGETSEFVRLGAPRWLDETGTATTPPDARFSSIGGSL